MARPATNALAARNFQISFIFIPKTGYSGVGEGLLRQDPLDQVLDLSHVLGGRGLHHLVFFFVTIFTNIMWGILGEKIGWMRQLRWFGCIGR